MFLIPFYIPGFKIIFLRRRMSGMNGHFTWKSKKRQKWDIHSFGFANHCGTINLFLMTWHLTNQFVAQINCVFSHKRVTSAIKGFSWGIWEWGAYIDQMLVSESWEVRLNIGLHSVLVNSAYMWPKWQNITQKGRVHAFWASYSRVKVQVAAE